MIEEIQSWLLGVTAASVCLAAFYTVLPKGAIRSIGRVSGGIVLMLVILQPLADWKSAPLRQRYNDYQQELDRQIALYREDYRQELERRIAEETGAYISDKAAQMGLTCHATVITRQEGDVPVPSEVKLDIPLNTALSQWITQELMIGEAKQHWEEIP